MILKKHPMISLHQINYDEVNVIIGLRIIAMNRPKQNNHFNLLWSFK